MPKLLEPTDIAWLYVIGEPDGPYKLGFSSKPTSRLKDLRLQTKRDLELLYWVQIPWKQARSIELLAHKTLSGYPSDGEWFTAPLAAMKRVAEMAPVEYAKIKHPLRPKAKGVGTAFRADDELAARIDAWRVRQPKLVARATAVRALVEEALKAAGL